MMRNGAMSDMSNGTVLLLLFFSSRGRHTRFKCDWSSDVCSSDLVSSHPVSPSLPRDPVCVCVCVCVRSEKRRVGKKCRSRWAPYHYKKKKRAARRRRVDISVVAVALASDVCVDDHPTRLTHETRVTSLRRRSLRLLFFFFQAEDGIRDSSVIGVQTCALPISQTHLSLTHTHTNAPLSLS